MYVFQVLDFCHMCLGHDSFSVIPNLGRLGHNWFSVANPCPHGDQNYLWARLGPSCLLDKVKCLMIKIRSPSKLDQNSIIKCYNLSRWRPYFYPLATEFWFGPWTLSRWWPFLVVGPWTLSKWRLLLVIQFWAMSKLWPFSIIGPWTLSKWWFLLVTQFWAMLKLWPFSILGPWALSKWQSFLVVGPWDCLDGNLFQLLEKPC
jgi:hypothetical protein